MAGFLHNLENNEAVLLMYLAGELPDEDRAEVESMLSRDAGLRAALERVRALDVAMRETMAASDRPIVAPQEDAAVRRVMRELRRKELELAARPAPPAVVASRRLMPWWGYPTSAAAAILLLVGLWGMGAFDRFMPAPEGIAIIAPAATLTDGFTAAELAAELQGSFALGVDSSSAPRIEDLVSPDDEDPLF